MQIGSFKPAKDFAFAGTIATMAVEGEFALKRVDSQNPEAPFFELFRRSPVHGKFVKVGAAWQKTSNSSGESFYVATLKDAGFTKGRITISFFHQEGGLAASWTPTHEQNARRAAARRAAAAQEEKSKADAAWDQLLNEDEAIAA